MIRMQVGLRNESQQLVVSGRYYTGNYTGTLFITFCHSRAGGNPVFSRTFLDSGSPLRYGRNDMFNCRSNGQPTGAINSRQKI